jgi:peptidoglycan/LPS O-acetylase OafA/YrhL
MSQQYNPLIQTQSPAALPAARPPTHQRLEWVDSLRGLAALAVLFFHLEELAAAPPGFAAFLDLPIISIIQDGRTAVTMFFVLSGFVLALPYARPRSDGAYRQLRAGSFYLRRIARIWLPWLIVFAASALAKATLFREYPCPISAEDKWLQKFFWQIPLTWPQFLGQLIYAVPDQRLELVPQDWSLRIEMIGSFLMPIILFLVRRNVLALIGAQAAAMVIYRDSYLYVPFLLGVILARYSVEFSQPIKKLGIAGKWTLLAVGLLLYNIRYLVPGEVHFRDRWMWCTATIGCALILLTAMGSNRIRSLFLEKPFILFIGRISYSLYLLHFLVILLFIPLWAWFCYRIGWDNRDFVYFSSFILSFILSILIAIPGYRWIEIPCLSLGKRISQRLDAR